jgi:tetratricopeptide (TPR) repeat protein
LKVKRRKGEEEAREKERDEEKIALKVKRGGARAGGGAEWGAFVAAGAAFGLLCLNRPNVLLCVAFVAGAIVLSPLVARGPSAARGPSSSFEENLRPLRPLAIAMVFVAGAVLTIAPVALRNLLVSREFVLVSSHGGLNFLVGNGTGASGAYRTLPGITPDIAGQAADTKRVAEAEEGRTLSTREVSAHFARKAWSWIAHEPAAAFSLFLRKIRLTLSEDEAPLNFSFPWYRERSTALKVLRVGPGLLVPLAGAGFILAFLASADAARRALLVWSVFVPSYVVAVAAFFVATRYRLPLLVALAPLAGAAVAEIPAALRAGRRRALAGALATAVVLGAVSLWPTGLWNGAADEEMHLVLWEIESGEPGAMAHAEAAAAAHPDPALVWLRVGRSFEAAGKLDDAITSLSRSRELGPQRGASLLLAGLLEKRGLQRVGSGDLAGGRADLEEAVRLDAASAPARLNLAVACAMAGETERARGLAREALALQPGYAKAEAFLKALR